MLDEFANFCCNIRYLRKKYALSQRQMAQKLKVSVGYVRMLERGQIPQRMGIATIWDAHMAFGIPIKDILEGLLEEADRG